MVATLAALAGASLEELAKQLQNPLADLVSIPFQNNFNGGGAAGNAAAYNLNFQPVIPIELDPTWNLIGGDDLEDPLHRQASHLALVRLLRQRGPSGGSVPLADRMVVTFMFPK